jgi:hypothetical protein
LPATAMNVAYGPASAGWAVSPGGKSEQVTANRKTREGDGRMARAWQPSGPKSMHRQPASPRWSISRRSSATSGPVIPDSGIRPSAARDESQDTRSCREQRIKKITLWRSLLRVRCNFGHGMCLFPGINLQLNITMKASARSILAATTAIGLTAFTIISAFTAAASVTAMAFGLLAIYGVVELMILTYAPRADVRRTWSLRVVAASSAPVDASSMVAFPLDRSRRCAA